MKIIKKNTQYAARVAELVVFARIQLLNMIADRNQILHALPIIDETAHLGQQNGGKIQDRRHLYGREHCHVVRFEKKMWNKLTQCRVVALSRMFLLAPSSV